MTNLTSTPTVRKVNNRSDWYQAICIINGRTFSAFGKSPKIARILLNVEIKKVREEMQGKLNF